MSKVARDAAAHRRARGGGYEAWGTVDANGQVLVDGGETAAPCTALVAIAEGDRVRVKVSGHRCIVTGVVTQ